MTGLIPRWGLLLMLLNANLYAENGLEAYRGGDYFKAIQQLKTEAEKNPIAHYYLGKMHLYGYGALKNNNLALRYFTLAAEKGVLEAQLFLGKYALNQEKNPEQALYWFKKAGINDISAEMYCAAAYLFGYGTKKNEDVSRKYYIDAAKKGNAIAQYQLALEFLRSRAKSSQNLGLIWLNKAVAQNNPRAKNKLGQLYVEGKLVPKDKNLGANLLLEAAGQSYAQAMVNLGKLAQSEGDWRKAENWYLQAANENNISAQIALSQLYAISESNLYRPEAAYLWMLKAAQNGSARAQKLLAEMYHEGKIINRDNNLFKEWSDEAKLTASGKQNKEMKVIHWLMNNQKLTHWKQTPYFLPGILTTWHNPLALKENNYNQAPQMEDVSRNELYQPKFVLTSSKDIPINEYFVALAPQLTQIQDSQWTFPRYPVDKRMEALINRDSYVLKHPTKQANFIKERPSWQPEEFNSWDYFNEKTQGWEHLANYQAALDELYNQAILGESTAQFELGQLYQYGIAVAKNPEQAVTYYQLAAEQQEVRAEYNLGLLYLEGKTTEKNFQKGIDWLTDAAFKGNANAQYVLGHILEKGWDSPDGQVHIANDENKAVAMYYLASANHFAPAEYRLANYLMQSNQQGLNILAQAKKNKLVKRLYKEAAQEGVIEAYLPLAFFYAMDQNLDEQHSAYQMASNLAQAGNSEADILLGLMLERGIGGETDPMKAMYWLQQAQRNPVTAFILGTHYCQGTSLNNDPEMCEKLLKESAAGGFSYGLLNLAILKHQKGEAFITELEQAKQKNNSLAGILLADYLLAQTNDPANMQQAANIYNDFAQKGDREGQLKLAYLYDRNYIPAAEAQNIAEKWYQASAEQGQPIAQFLLGRMYQLGKVNDQPNYNLAKNWYQKAQAHYPKAAVALGFIFETVDDNYEKAVEYYQSAAKAQIPNAWFNLGLVYEKGKDHAVDYPQAEALYKQAAQALNSSAMESLANLYFHGFGMPRNENLAIQWFKQAAALKDSEALYQLGLLSETGVATPLDFVKAMDYYEQAAGLGNEKAKLALARMFKYGLGTKKNIDKAMALYQELAQNDNAYAQYQLALADFKTAGANNLLAQGKIWLHKATMNGSLQAQSMLQSLQAQEQKNVSFIEPMLFKPMPVLTDHAANLMYLNALSEWNKGDETLSRRILDRLVTQYPDYLPAKKAYEQLNQQANLVSKESASNQRSV